MNLANTSNPFVGLRAFESEESLLFFGRQQQTLELLHRLHQYHFVAVVGTSGSGKSSLIRAGLIPSLKAGYLVDDRDRWMIAMMKPGQSPIYNLASALLQGITGEENNGQVISLERKIKEEGSDAVIDILKPLSQKKNTNVFLLVDQFEELFRFSMEHKKGDKVDEANDFVNIILELSRQTDLPVYVVITMRSDFIGDCAGFFGLPEAMNESQYLVPRLNRVQLKNVIEGPVRLYGAKITPALSARLLNDLQETKDELPILQHALMRTWDVWKRKNDPNSPIDTADYTETGTMSHALSRHAEEAYAELNTDRQRHICEIMFKALTDKEDARGIRRPQQLIEIALSAEASNAEVTDVINVFRKAGRAFLVPPENVRVNEASVIDISHESLMRVWDRLAQWVEEENKSEEIYLRLSQAAVLYENGTGGLWRNPELQIALNWKKEYAPNATWAKRSNNLFDKAMLFLQKSREQVEFEVKEKEKLQKQRLQRARTAVAFVSLVAIVAILLAFYAFTQTKLANKKTKEAQEATVQQQIAKNNAIRQEFIANREKQKADSSAAIAKEQQSIAEREQKNAIASATDAINQKKLAEQEKATAEFNTRRADTAQLKAESSATDALLQKAKADSSANAAKKAKEKANSNADEARRAENRAQARNLANESVILLNENRFDSAKKKTIEAFDKNKENRGPEQNNDIYNALNLSWVKSINSKNQSDVHKLPVRSISGMPNSNIVFTADESGMIWKSEMRGDILQKLDSFKIKENTDEELRALSVSPDGTNLVAITSAGNGKILNISASHITILSAFKFKGIGKAIAFSDNDNFILLSNSGIGKYLIKNPLTQKTLDNNTISAFAIGRSGKFYIASGRQVKVYNGWEGLLFDSLPETFPDLDSKITSLAVDVNEQFIAAGSYGGSVWLKNLKNSKSIPWTRGLHISSVNDLKFSRVVNNKVQLAAAGADQTIKLIDVKDIMQNKNAEDVLTLSGHNKWIYSLYYSPDGKWLFSTGEDNKVVAWKPSMDALYQALKNK